MSYKTITQLCASSIVKKAMELQTLTLAVRAQLPPAIQPHCWVASYENGILILFTDQSIYFSLLKREEDTFQKILKEDPLFEKLQGIQFQVNPRCAWKQKESPTFEKRLSPETTQLLQQTAAHIQDPKLRESLESLAENGAEERLV